MTKKTQAVVIDGVKYSLTSEGYDKLQVFLNGADVLEKTLLQRAPANKLKDVLTWHYNEVIIYNCVTGKSLTPIYNGQQIYSNVSDDAKKLKSWLKTHRISLAYLLLKQINVKDFPGAAKLSQPDQDIHTDATGKYIIYNFVIKDNDGNLKMMFPGWMGLRSCWVGNAMWVFFSRVRDTVHKNAIIKAYSEHSISK